MMNCLSRLVKMIIWSLPVEDPHPEQRQEGQIVDFGPIHLMKPLRPSDHMGPKLIVEEEVQICVTPPSVMCGSCVLPSPHNPVKGILGNLSISLSVSYK